MKASLGIIYSVIVIQISATPAPSNDSEANDRIFGGVPVKSGEFRSTVGLHITFEDKSYTTCTGTAVDSFTALTAAHCIKGAVEVAVQIACLDMDRCEQILFGEAFIHPDYGKLGNVTPNDVGVVRTEEPMDVPEFAQVDTPLRHYQTCVMTKYGYLGKKPASPNLKIYKLEVNDVKYCSAEFPGDNRYDNMLCSFNEMGRRFYRGDSGGPLFCRNKQVGVLSMLMDAYNNKTQSNQTMMLWAIPQNRSYLSNITVMSASNQTELTTSVILIFLLHVVSAFF